MKKIFFSILFCTFTLFSFSSNSHIENVTSDTKASTIKWIGSKLTSSHEGNISIQKGYLSIDHGTLVSGQFAINMNSITCTDIENETYNNKLVEHLKNEDFFNVKSFPIAIITIVKTIKGKGDMYKVIADLTIKGITHSVAFDADVKIDGLNYVAKAKIQIDRTKWDIKYGSGSFFEDLGDKMIKDEVEFIISLVSNK